LSWLYYSDRMTYLPLGVIGVAVATVILPDLARQKHHDQNVYSATVDWALQTVLWVGVPAALALFVLAGPILATLFLHGNYGVHDVYMTQRSLWAFALGLPAFMLIKILASAFYATQDVKTPVRIAVVALVINLLGNILLIHSLAHAGLALSTTIAAYVNALGLAVILIKRRIYCPQVSWKLYFIRMLVSCSLMVSVLLFFCPPLSLWLSASLAYKVLHLATLIVSGSVVYFLSMHCFGWRWR
jgi:putative peptidoglycan lipid II flippase